MTPQDFNYCKMNHPNMCSHPMPYSDNHICCCIGATGTAGTTGATGATGAAGSCECTCKSTGEMIVNGGMEFFTNNIPTGWTTTTPTEISHVTLQGRVHSGDASVNLQGGANLSQIVSIKGGCYYEFSFFAHAEGADVGFEATVTFITPPNIRTEGLKITVNLQDVPNSNREFAFYRRITIAAPSNATQAEIMFFVTSNGNQSLDLDDVSFSVK